MLEYHSAPPPSTPGLLLQQMTRNPSEIITSTVIVRGWAGLGWGGVLLVTEIEVVLMSTLGII